MGKISSLGKVNRSISLVSSKVNRLYRTEQVSHQGCADSMDSMEFSKQELPMWCSFFLKQVSASPPALPTTSYLART